MQAKAVAKKVEEFALPIVEKHGLELVEAEFVKEGANYYLRLYIDKENGVAINDCELVSRELDANSVLDTLIEQNYTLEVSSPGIDRVLKKDKEFIKYKGRIVEIKLFKPIDKVKEFQGELVGLIDNNIVIKTDGVNELSFSRKEVSTCRLHVDF